MRPALPLLCLLLAGIAGAEEPGPRERPCPFDALRSGGLLQAALEQGADELWVGGTVSGDFTLKRPLKLHGCEEATLEGSGKRTVLTVESDGVLLEDLRLTRSGSRPTTEDAALKVKGKGAVLRHLGADDTLYGFALEGCAGCTLEWSTVVGRPIDESLRGDGIKLWEAHGSTVRHCRVEAVRDVVVWYSRQVTVEDNTIVHGRYGTHFMYAHDSVARRNTLRQNVVGVFVMYSNRVTAEDNVLAGARGAAGMGIGFKESDSATLRRNDLVANSTGVYFDRTPFSVGSKVELQGNAFALNGVAMRFHNSEHDVLFEDNDFRDNDVLAEVDGGGDALGVTFLRNHWDDYAGYDLDGNREGDVPFVIKQRSGQLGAARPQLRFFHGTASLALYDAIAEAMPFFASKKLLEDPHPSMRPHRELSR